MNSHFKSNFLHSHFLLQDISVMEVYGSDTQDRPANDIVIQ